MKEKTMWFGVLDTIWFELVNDYTYDGM